MIVASLLANSFGVGFIAWLDDFDNVSQTGPLPEISVQRETYMRGNENEKKIEQSDFPAKTPESTSDKCETGNAEHSVHDLSSESLKECFLTEISESCDRCKNDDGANQAEKHII
jgi:hypothetical protein